MIVYISNFLNQHQYPLAEELFRQSGGEYRFIETDPTPDSFKRAGYPSYSNRPYLVQAWKSEADQQLAHKLIINADVVAYESIDSISIIKERLKAGKLTFEVGERWLKKGIINLLSPRLLKSQWEYHTYFYNKPLYRLCASAFAAGDLALMRSFKGRCYKWGYFTDVAESKTDTFPRMNNGKNDTSFIVIARLIKWKHNELIVWAANILKSKGYSFSIDIFGTGPEECKLREMISELSLDGIIHLRGNCPNTELVRKLRTYNAMILASDRNEGWGAVVNEGMANACPVISSHEVGCAPYLISSGKNGLIFKSGDVRDLTAKMEIVIKEPETMRNLAHEAYKTMREEWSPKCASRNFIQLSNYLMKRSDELPLSGPCSPA